jgi:hypothetical protein
MTKNNLNNGKIYNKIYIYKILLFRKQEKKKKRKKKKKKLFGCGILCVREIEIIRGPFYALFSGRFGKCGQCVSNVGNVANVGAADLID